MKQRAADEPDPRAAADAVLPMAAIIESLDWSGTPLGPMSGWSHSLRTVVRLMLDSRYAMWMAWGPQLTFFCNDAYRPTLGIKHDFIGAPASRVWAEIWPDIGPRIDRVLRTGEATWDEGLLLYLERSGYKEETYHTFSYSPVRGDSGGIEGMLCVVTEDTPRRLAERRLATLAALSGDTLNARTVAETCTLAMQVLGQSGLDLPFALIYLLDDPGVRGRLVACAGLEPGGLPPYLEPEAAGWSNVTAPGDMRPTVVVAWRGVLPAACAPWPEPVSRAMVLPIARQGQAQELAGWLVAGLSPRLTLDGEYERFLALVAIQVGNSIAGARAFEEERLRVEQLAELDRAKTTFFANISHELRTPLTLIASPIDELLATEGDPARQRLLQLTRRNAQRLQKLVNSLLEFARIEAGRVQATFEPVDLAVLTRDLASSFRSAIEQAGLDYRVECPALPQPVYVDRDMWEKIVLNLLSNAFKFTFDGAITLRLATAGHGVELEVADTGIGVPAAEMPRLFERFHRIEGVSGRTQEGSGIGLALVQELVRMHGGEVAASSEPGVGTRFTVQLPYGRGHLPADRVHERAAKPSPIAEAQAYVQEALSWSGSGAEAMASLTDIGAGDAPRADPRFAETYGAHIVLADDNADMRAYLHRLLGGNYAVEAVANGEEALAEVRRRRPDLLVADVMMPRLDGFGLVKAVRADACLKSLPVVLLSARAGEEARIEGLDAGVDDYLVKPFSPRELLARIGAVLERSQQRAERERVLQALQRRTAQFEALLNEAPIGVFLVDAELRIIEMNPSAQPVFEPMATLGCDFGELMRRMWNPPFADEVVQRFRHTLESGEAYVERERVEPRRDRGVVEYYEWRIHRLPLPDGGRGVVCYFRDISSHVQARIRLEASDRQKDEFLAMLAHELRNPLASIRSAGDLLARIDDGGERVQQVTGVLQRQARLLTRLVDDLLEVSRITMNRIQLDRRELPLAEIIAQAVEMVGPQIEQKRHSLVVTAAGYPRVLGDRARLVQCVVNLLTNAAKYTPPEGEIRIDSGERGGRAWLRVADNGAGIGADLLPQVFDLFVQSDRTLDRADGGLGIGLSLVRRLVELHEGEVDASSAGPGRGATFEIRLPIAVPTPSAAGRESPVEVRPRRVFIVDDNEDAAVSLAMLLEVDGHEVAMAHRPSAALERLPEISPDVVLLDIGLPEMDGYEVARRMRATSAGARAMLVALTGYGQESDRRRALGAGFDEHLVKPVDVDRLAQVLARAPQR